jgi:glycosyltransferase involved in cell wall biosynthesis
VRNGEAHLDGWFESVERFADVVLALDDGSTDGTRALLDDHPIVSRVLENPVRPSDRGWHDAENRARLLDAAGSVHPRWVMFLDADERIPPDDGAALRAFLEDGADPRDGYLFRVYRMITDLAHYDRATLWVGRLFAYRHGLRLPAQRLHAVALPTSIPASHRRRTTIRIQHLAGLTEHDRRARFEKYREVDPRRTHQSDYSRLLAPPGPLRPWWPRSRHLPVLANQPVPDPPTDPGDDAPVLSAIVIAQDDESRIKDAVRAVTEQECPEPFETIVVTSGRDRTAEIVRARFPGVDVVALDHPALPGEARNAGLRVARGRYVSFPGSHVVVMPGSFAARVRAHRGGSAMVTGSIFNGTDTPAGWGWYFLDNASALQGCPSEVLDRPPARCSYLREALLEVGGFPEDVRVGEDTLVNAELFERGYSAHRVREVGFVHRIPSRTTPELIRRQFARGRAMGRILFDGAGGVLNGRIVRFVAFASSAARLVRTTRAVVLWGDGLRTRYLRAVPLVVLGAVSSWLGGCYELASLARRARRPRAATRSEIDHDRRRARETP